MQTTVATLAFVTAAVLLSCVVVEFAVVTCEQTLDTEDMPQMDRIRQMEETIANQTSNLLSEIESFNQTEIMQMDQLMP
jgi:hypothetical protein